MHVALLLSGTSEVLILSATLYNIDVAISPPKNSDDDTGGEAPKEKKEVCPQCGNDADLDVNAKECYCRICGYRETCCF